MYNYTYYISITEHFLYCVLNYILPTCKPNFVENARALRRTEQTCYTEICSLFRKIVDV